MGAGSGVHRHARLGLIAPFLVTSLPAAYLGGTLNLPKAAFQWLLLSTLILLVLSVALARRYAAPTILDEVFLVLPAVLLTAVTSVFADNLGIRLRSQCRRERMPIEFFKEIGIRWKLGWIDSFEIISELEFRRGEFTTLGKCAWKLIREAQNRNR